MAIKMGEVLVGIWIYRSDNEQLDLVARCDSSAQRCSVWRVARVVASGANEDGGERELSLIDRLDLVSASQ